MNGTHIPKSGENQVSNLQPMVGQGQHERTVAMGNSLWSRDTSERLWP